MKLGKIRLWDVCGFLGLFVWLFMMGILVNKTCFWGPAKRLSNPDISHTIEEVGTWMAIYQYTDKVGYTHSKVSKEADGFMVSEKAGMNLRLGGGVHRISTEITGHLNADASLRSFEFRLRSGLVRFEAVGKVEKGYLVLKTGFGAHMTQSKVALDKSPFLSVGFWPYIVKEGMTVGTHYRLPVFDPFTMAQRFVDVKVMSRETIVLSGRRWDAFKVKTRFMGTNIITWIASNGEKLKEEGLMGLRLVRTTKERALSGMRSAPETDIARNVSIPCNMALKDISKLSYLRVDIGGINFKGLDLQGGRQHLAGSILEITVEPEPFSPALPLSNKKENLERYLKAGVMIQSDNPTITALASKITSPAKDSEDQVRLILEWVYTALDKRATLCVPNALSTLEARAGDCNEHAVLFAALARAVGIPTKLCAGLVYFRGRFYYHAWNEVFLGKWITVDALMGQLPADVTHIRFVDGGVEDQVDMVQVIGRVKLDVLEVK